MRGHLVGEERPRPDGFGDEIDEEMEVDSACLISVFTRILDGHQYGAQPPAHPSMVLGFHYAGSITEVVKVPLSM